MDTIIGDTDAVDFQRDQIKSMGGRLVTYQLILRGCDGMVIASDQRELLTPNSFAGDEGSGSVVNMVRKIRADNTGRFAWAFAGAKPSILAASYLEREFEDGLTEERLERTLRDCGDRGWEQGASGPNQSSIILADGKTKRIWRLTIAHKASVVMEIQDGRCFAGQTYSKASFFPERYYSPDLPVSRLAMLAAFTVITAGKMDPLLVAGLDIAIYREAAGRFEFMDSDIFRSEAERLDAQIRAVFRDAL